MSDTTYIMEDPREAQRLADKVDAEAWVEKHIFPLDLTGKSILDVGCGPGVIAREIAKSVPNAQIVGLDLSPSRLRIAQLNANDHSNITFKQGDAQRLPYGDCEFDFVYCRFLLEYLSDKETAVREMYRVLKPSGRVLLQDLDGQLLWNYPEDNELQSRIEATLKSLAKTGFDPFIGRKLFTLAHRVGFTNLDVRIEPYHQIIGRIDLISRGLWETKLDIALPAAACALGDSVEADRLKHLLLDYFDRADSLTYSMVFTVIGEK